MAPELQTDSLICETEITEIAGSQIGPFPVRLMYQWHPDLRMLLKFGSELQPYAVPLFFCNPFPFTLKHAGSLKGSIGDWNEITKEGSILILNNPLTTLNTGVALSSLYFDIVNFPKYSNGPVKSNPNLWSTEVLHINLPGWSVSLQQELDDRATWKKLRKKRKLLSHILE